MYFSLALERARLGVTATAAAAIFAAAGGAPVFADPPADATATAKSVSTPSGSPSAPTQTPPSATTGMPPSAPAAGRQSMPAGMPSIPAGARLRFHLMAPLASNRNKAGDTFSFEMLEPVAVDGRVLVAQGALGSGTILVSGKSGTSGHEGDLTLRLDSVSASMRDKIFFADQKIEINGRNRKVMSGVLGFVPFAGIGAIFIHGADIRIDTATPIETVLSRPATMSATTSAAGPAS